MGAEVAGVERVAVRALGVTGSLAARPRSFAVTSTVERPANVVRARSAISPTLASLRPSDGTRKRGAPHRSGSRAVDVERGERVDAEADHGPAAMAEEEPQVLADRHALVRHPLLGDRAELGHVQAVALGVEAHAHGKAVIAGLEGGLIAMASESRRRGRI